MIADDVVVELDAKIDGYTRKLDQASAKFDRTIGSINAGAQRMGKGVSVGLGLAAGAVGGLVGGLTSQLPAAIMGAIKAGLDYASSLGELSQQLGVTTTELQEYTYAASQTGIESKQMESALAFLTKGLGMLGNGAKKQVQAMRELGFSTKEMAEISQKSAGEALPILAEALKGIPTPAERARLGMILMGRGFQRMAPLLADGAKGIDELRQAAHRLGLVLSEEQIQNADRTADKLSEMKQVLSLKIAGIVADNSNAIMGLANSLMEVVSAAGRAAVAYQDFMAILDTKAFTVRSKNPFLSPESRKEGARLAARARGRISDNGVSEGAGGNWLIKDIPQGRTGKTGNPALDAEIARKLKKTGNRLAAPSGAAGGDGAGMDDALAKINASGKKTKGGGGGADDAEQKARELARARQEAADNLRQYTNELSRMEGELLTATAQLSGNYEQQAEAAIRNLEIQRDIDLREIAADEALNDAKRKELKSVIDKQFHVDKQLVEQETEAKVAEDRLSMQLASRDREQDLLRAQLVGVKDRKKRAEIERQLVDLAFQQQKLELEAVVASGTATQAQKDIAAERLKILGVLKASATGEVDKANQSPGAAYADELGDKVANINDEIEKIAVDKFRDLGEAMGNAVPKALGLKGILGSLIGELAKLAIQALILKPIMDTLFKGGTGTGGAAGGSNWMTAITSIFSKVGKRAGGGSVLGGGSYLVGERGPELFKPASNGNVIPNHRLGQQGSAPVVRVLVGANDYFDARVENVSGRVAAETVATAAPSIVEASSARTLSAMNRPRM